MFVTQPITHLLRVYWFNPASFFPLLYTLSESNTNDWPGFTQEGDWMPVAVWGNSKLTNLVWVEMVDRLISIAISFSNPIYASTISLVSKKYNPHWGRFIKVTPFSVMVAEVYSNQDTETKFNQTITEYLTVDPYEVVVMKRQNLYNWKIRFPLVGSSFFGSNNFYILADNTLGGSGVLCYKAMEPQASALYYIAPVNGNPTDKVVVSAGGGYDDYLLVINTNSSTLSAYFLPTVPTLRIVPPNVPSTVYSMKLDFSVRVSSMNNQQESILGNLNVVNPQL